MPSQADADAAAAMTDAQWSALLNNVRKDRNNCKFSGVKHHHSADVADRNIMVARVATTIGSLAVAGSTAGSALAASSLPPRTKALATIGGTVISLLVPLASNVYLAPVYIQKSISHREAGEEFLNLARRFDSFLAVPCLDPAKTIDEVAREHAALAGAKQQLDTRFKDATPTQAVHNRCKVWVHGSHPEPSTWRQWFDASRYYAEWTQAWRQKEAVEVQKMLAQRKSTTAVGAPSHSSSL